MKVTTNREKEYTKDSDLKAEVRKLVRAYNARLNSAIGTYGRNSVVVKEMMKQVETIPETIIQFSSRGTGFIATGDKAIEKMASKLSNVKAIARKTKEANVTNIIEKLEKNYNPDRVIQGPFPKNWKPNRKERVARLELVVPYVKSRTKTFDDAFAEIYSYYDPSPHSLMLAEKFENYIDYYEKNDDKETPYHLAVRIANREISKDELRSTLNFDRIVMQSKISDTHLQGGDIKKAIMEASLEFNKTLRSEDWRAKHR